jgi:HK97 gp10 family phage protein
MRWTAKPKKKLKRRSEAHDMSVEMGVQFEGQDEFQLKMERADASMKALVQQRLEELAEVIKETAQRIAPVRTGYLRSTIFTETDEWTVKVGASAPYAAYVEFGTRFMYGRLFLSQAVEMHRLQLVNMVDQAVNESVLEVNR